MHSQIYVNLPIKDMTRSRAFFGALGYQFEPRFSNEQGACLILGENLYAMLLVEPFFGSFVPHKAIGDATTAAEVLICLNCNSRDEVDAIVAKAVAAGGTSPRPPQNHGFMYSKGYEDLDGHIWELMYVDASTAANPDQDA
ncbi:VOC family protein [Roseateles sp. GG27B]